MLLLEPIQSPQVLPEQVLLLRVLLLEPFQPPQEPEQRVPLQPQREPEPGLVVEPELPPEPLVREPEQTEAVQPRQERIDPEPVPSLRLENRSFPDSQCSVKPRATSAESE